MPRYFFNTANGSRHRDTEGMELKDHGAARKGAIRYAGAVMHDQPDVLWDGRHFHVEVTDGKDTLLFTIITMAVNAPAAGDVK